MAKSYRFFVTCPTGFEHQLTEELKNILELSVIQKTGGAEFDGSFEDGEKVCLWSRIGGKVLLALEDFYAEDESEIYERSKRIRWNSFFSSDKSIAVDTTLASGSFKNASFLSLKVKDGISDHFRGSEGKRPDVDKQDPDIRINLFVLKNRCTISINISGASLNKRGYRKPGALAPLKENLAAALLIRAGWEKIAADGGSFIDPMCGSGTFLIEAAMIAGNIAPALLRRNFSFMHLHQFKKPEWKNLVDNAIAKQKPDIFKTLKIYGFDIDRNSVSSSLQNIERCGFKNLIPVKTADISNIEKIIDFSKIKPGLAAINLPYGKRLEADGGLAELYELTGSKLKENFDSWKVLTLSGDEELSRKLGMKPLQVNTVYNGAIKTVSAIFKIDTAYREQKIDKETGEPKPKAVNPDFYSEDLANRIKKNIKNLKKWKEKENISCYRIYDADIPEYAASIDFYEGEHLFIQEYAAPSEIPEEKAEKRLRDIIYTAHIVTGIAFASISVRQKRRQRGSSQYQKLDSKSNRTVIHESGLEFYADFSSYLDTGIFLDHRIIRGKIKELAEGKKFLNLFSYTATASVYAASGGASLTVSVDSNNTYSQWAKENFELNQLSLKSNKIVTEDSINFLEKDKQIYDLIFIDPPTFSNSKSREAVFDIQKDHENLIRLALKRVAENGIIIFSSNFKKFKLNDSIEEEFLAEDITEKTVSPDFSRHGTWRKCWIIKNR